MVPIHQLEAQCKVSMEQGTILDAILHLSNNCEHTVQRMALSGLAFWAFSSAAFTYSGTSYPHIQQLKQLQQNPAAKAPSAAPMPGPLASEQKPAAAKPTSAASEWPAKMKFHPSKHVTKPHATCNVQHVQGNVLKPCWTSRGNPLAVPLLVLPAEKLTLQRETFSVLILWVAFTYSSSMNLNSAATNSMTKVHSSEGHQAKPNRNMGIIALCFGVAFLQASTFGDVN